MNNKSFLSSITTLASGSIAGQLIVLLCAPILTRLFTPDEIGSYTYLVSFAAIFMGIINGKYDMAIVTETEEKKVFALIKLSFIVGIGLTVIGTIIFILYNYFFVGVLRVEDIAFIFCVLFSYALIDILTSYNNRQREYKILAGVNIVRVGCQNIGAVLLGLIHLGKIGLIIPYVIGQYLGAHRQGKSLRLSWHEIKRVTKEELREVMIKHKRQPLFSAPAALANSFSYSSITVFLTTLFGNTVVGFYSISVRVLGLPLSIISGNVAKVFFESASREYNETGQFRQSFKRVFLFQLFLAIPMVVIMYYFAPLICEFVFGDEWRVAGEYVKILAPMFGIRFIVTTLTPAMVVVKKQNYELFVQLMFVMSSLFCFLVIKHFSLSIEEYLTIISLSFSIVYLIYLILIYRYSK